MLEATDTPALRFLLDARQLPPRRLDVPVADARLPRLDRDRRRTPTCTASRTSSGGTASEQRLVEYGSSFARAARRRASRSGAPRHDRQPERAAPLAQRRDGVRGARGRRAHDGGDQHHDLPRPPPAPLADPGLPARARAEALLLLQRLRVRPDRRADRRCATARVGSIDAYAAAVGRWLVTRDGFDLLVYYLPDYDYASHALGPGRGARGARARGRGDRRALRRGRRAGRVPRALRGRRSAPTTARRASSRRRGSTSTARS